MCACAETITTPIIIADAESKRALTRRAWAHNNKNQWAQLISRMLVRRLTFYNKKWRFFEKRYMYLVVYRNCSYVVSWVLWSLLHLCRIPNRDYSRAQIVDITLGQTVSASKYRGASLWETSMAFYKCFSQWSLKLLKTIHKHTNLAAANQIWTHRNEVTFTKYQIN